MRINNTMRKYRQQIDLVHEYTSRFFKHDYTSKTFHMVRTPVQYKFRDLFGISVLLVFYDYPSLVFHGY